MRGKNLIVPFRHLPRTLVAVVAILAGLWALTVPPRAMANDLPQAAGSPLSGVSFDDRPLLLPVQRNFQMAMLTASSQIGRSCGRMESYGWRMAQTEQHRVNLIFSNTVDRLRGLGYAVEAQTPSSISKDITLFTADRPDKHFLFMWSAGEIGLVMVLCESSPPLTGRMATMYNATAASALPQPQDVVKSKLETPLPSAKARKIYDANGFTPVGDWIGDYTCMRGYTGATMHIDKFKGDDFKGTFRFYPTSKNPYVAKGSYEIYGQYDRESRRILINPGKWLEHPAGTYKTIIVGSFDPIERTFSGFFQGIMGCTSFEAKSDGRSAEVPTKKIAKKHVKPKKKPNASAQKVPEIKNPTPDEAIAPAAAGVPPVTGDINLPDTNKVVAPAAPPQPMPAAAAPPTTPPTASAPAPAVPVAAPPPNPSPPPASAPAPVSSSPPPSPPPPAAVLPSPGASVAPPAWSPTPSAAPSQPSPQPSPASPPATAAPTPVTPPTSSLAPKAGPHAIMLAANWPPAPSAPQANITAPSYNLTVPQYNVTPPSYPVNPPQANLQPPSYPVNPPQADLTPQVYDLTVPRYPVAPTYNPTAERTTPQAPYYPPAAQADLTSPSYNLTPPQYNVVPPTYTIYKPPGS